MKIGYSPIGLAASPTPPDDLICMYVLSVLSSFSLLLLATLLVALEASAGKMIATYAISENGDLVSRVQFVL